MWIFGQVWFACLVGFAAGVLLDWVVRVRPLANRVRDLETRLEAETRSMRAEAVASGGSMFERGSYDAPGRFDSTGFEGDRGRGLLTPSGNLTSDLLDHSHPHPPSSVDSSSSPVASVSSGVEDYPGVARLSGIWADESAEETRVTHTPPSAWESEEPATWDAGEASAAEAASVPLGSDADQQYLEFLRSGGAEPIAAGQDETPNEVTSVLPYTIPGEDAEGYQPYEAYDEFSGNGYGGNGHHDSGYSEGYGEYADDVVEPAESSGPLPHRETSDFGNRYAPFEIPFGQFDNSDVQPHAGEMTPIGETGFQPFQKQPGLADEPTDASSWFDLTDPRHLTDAGQLTDAGHLTDPRSGSVGLGSAGSAAMTSRMLPVGQPGAEHPDLLGTSVFGSESDLVYEDDGRSRSLFEPVIAPDSVADSVPDEYGYGYHAYDVPAYETPSYDAPAYDPTAGQGTTPRPVRVRTGMDPVPANGFVESVGSAGLVGSGGSHSLATDRMDIPPGPFGPGSALPMPDGAAPSAEFRVKARTSSMVFHTESSPFYERLEPQVWFRDAKDAQRAGFTSWERPRSW